MALETWPSWAGVQVGTGPILTCVGGTVNMGQINQFEPHSLKFDAADEVLILALYPFTKLEIVQTEVGIIGYGYVFNPEEQITARDEHTITMELPWHTSELTWRRTGRFWGRTNYLSVIAAQIVEPVAGWTGIYTDGGTNDRIVPANLANPTLLGGFLETAKNNEEYVRIGRDNNGIPVNRLEMGQFGALSQNYFVSADGADSSILEEGPNRLVVEMTRQPNDVRDLMNLCEPVGGGNDANSLASLERCWRIVNDPGYPNYGRWGTDAESKARTISTANPAGLGTLFPEYDENYPISDPENPPTGATQYVGGVLFQGAHGTRRFANDGHALYYMYDKASYAQWGYREGLYIESSISDNGDPSALNQEIISRSLYVATKTQFLHFSHPHHTITMKTPGDRRPVQEGDLVTVDFQRATVMPEGFSIVETNVVENLRIMKVVRNFNGDDPPMDDVTVSNLGRFDQDDASNSADLHNQVIALQLQQGTSFSPVFFGPFAGNVDAATPLTFPVRIPDTLYQWGRCTLEIEFQPFDSPSTTAYSDKDIDIFIPTEGEDILLDIPDNHDLENSGTFNADGTGATGTTDGFATDLFLHVYGTSGSPGATVGVGFQPGPQADVMASVSSHDLAIYRKKNPAKTDAGLDTNTTKSTFTAPIGKSIRKAGQIIARIKGHTNLAKLPTHVHKLNVEVAKGPTPVDCIFSINGIAISSGVKLLSGSRDPVTGAFTSNVQIDDMGKYIEFPGQRLEFKFEVGTNAGNLTGAGRLQISGTWFGQFGGLAAVVRAG